MMNGGSPYYNGASMIAPAGYTPAPVEQNTGGGYKKLIILGIIVLVLLTAGIIATVVLINQNASSEEEGVEAEPTVYDSGDDSTGGEEVSTPQNQSLDFLKNHNLSDDDISTVRAEISKKADQYYTGIGYNFIEYDLSSVKKTSSQITFSFKTDTDDREYNVIIKHNDGHVESVDVYQDELAD